MNVRICFFWIALVGALALFSTSSCDEPRIFVERGTLNFSTDTVAFDSIFTTFQAPSGRLIVRNRSGENVRISQIFLESGPDTEFDLLVNGVKTNFAEDVDLADGDSLYIFVTFRSELKDMYVEEFITFKVGEENPQRVLIRALVLDAYLIKTWDRDSTGQLFIRAESVITRDTTFTPDKKIVIDGPLFVDEGATLTLEPGTQLFFTPFQDANFNLFSLIYIADGSLKAIGTPGFPIVMQGTRFDSTFSGDYKENPGQWRGIWFGPTSQNNILQHVLLKNGLIGVRIDSTSYLRKPRVRISNTEIRNMAYAGIWGVGFDPTETPTPMLVMENSLVHRCGERTVLLSGGGNYEFYNCTFYNESIQIGQRQAQLSVNNYFYDPQLDAITAWYPLRARFNNCIIAGTEEEELALDSVAEAPFDLAFDHCIVTTSDDPERTYDYGPYFRDVQENVNPLFTDSRLFDFRLEAGSPAIDAGRDYPERYELDFRGDPAFPRESPYDIGAYEFVE